MAPPLHAIAIFLAAACMLVVVVSSSPELEEKPPSPPSTTAAASAPLHPSNLVYTMQYRIGNTAVSGIADTGSDLVWTNNSQLFDSSVSCPFEAGKEMDMICCHDLATFEREYGHDVKVRGVMGEAKLTFEAGQSSYTTPALNIGSAVLFGCHLPGRADPKQACSPYRRGGIVGLGRGKMSLVTQLGLHSFSYCLPSQKTTGQIKLFKDAAAPLEGATETKLATIKGSSLYYVQLEKIQLGSTNIQLSDCPKEERSSAGNGDMAIDSGSSFTLLPKQAFDYVKMEVKEIVKNKTDKEPKEVHKDGFSCYDGPYPDGIKDRMVLHFCDGARMEIPAENYLYKENEDSFCLAFKQQPQDDNQMSILGAYQQRGLHMLFNIQSNTLSFAENSACGQS